MPGGSAWTSIELMLGTHAGELYTIRRERDVWVAYVNKGTEGAFKIIRESPGEALVAVCKAIDARAIPPGKWADVLMYDRKGRALR